MMNLLPCLALRLAQRLQFDGPELSHEITLHNMLEDANPAGQYETLLAKAQPKQELKSRLCC